jgi:hypothetical protein
VVTGRSRPIKATHSWPGANEAGCPPIVYDVTADALARDQARALAAEADGGS